MTEEVLRRFFSDEIQAQTLSQNIKGSVETEGITSKQHIEDMNEDFLVCTGHLVKVCDSFLRKELSGPDVEAIAFCLVSSDHFFWNGDEPDGSLCAETIFDWSAPDINFAINEQNMQKYRNYLLTGLDFRGKRDLPGKAGRIISIKEKK